MTDKGPSGRDTEDFFASEDLALTLIRPARKDENIPGRSRTGSASASRPSSGPLKNQLGLERHGGRVPAGLWTRLIQRLLALNTVSWHNWQTGVPVKRSLIAYDHI